MTDRIRIAIISLAALAVGGIILLVAEGQLDAYQIETLDTLLGAVVGYFASIVGFYFGRK